MAGRPLSPAIRLRLGGPLPRLLADRTRVPHLSAYAVLASVSKCCPPAGDRSSRVTHPSATWLYSKQASYITPFDLHVLGTPPAFVLSQDQTLRLIPVSLQLIHSFRMNQSPAQVARLFFYLLNFRFRSARFGAPAPRSLSASASVSLLCIPLSWCLAALFQTRPEVSFVTALPRRNERKYITRPRIRQAFFYRTHGIVRGDFLRFSARRRD